MRKHKTGQVFNPLAVVESWKKVPGTLSHEVQDKPGRLPSNQRLMSYVQTLPPEERSTMLAEVAQKRRERMERTMTQLAQG